MQIASFTQTCSDELLEEFVKECSRITGESITSTKEGGKTVLHCDTQDKVFASGIAKRIERLFEVF